MKNNRTLDVYEKITQTIIAAIESGCDDYAELPWNSRGGTTGLPKNVATGNYYQGVNILSLWSSAQLNGYTTSEWGTYKQWNGIGAQVRKGEKASHVIFYQEIDDDDEEEKPSSEKKYWGRTSYVFNACQVDGYKTSILSEENLEMRRLEQIENFVSNTGAVIQHGGNRAFYNRIADFIQMPDKHRFNKEDAFLNTENYYLTLLHELVHWTGHEDRLDREKGKKFGDKAYAFEELIAELGSAYLCAILGLTKEPSEEHSKYIANWLKGLRGDNKFIFRASSKAQQSVKFLSELQD